MFYPLEPITHILKSRDYESKQSFCLHGIRRFPTEGGTAYGTAHVYQSTLRRVMEFEGEETLDFKDLTPAWLKSFQDHLLDSRLQWNTVSTYMRMLRAIYFRAVDDGVAPYRSRLFKGVYTYTTDGEARGGRRDLSQAQRSRR